MPAFAQSAGGVLTDEQIDILFTGMRQRWGVPLRSQARRAAVRSRRHGRRRARWREVYAANVPSAMARPARAGTQGGSIVDASYLALVSDQALRTLVIAGRPDLASRLARLPHGQPLTAQKVADVVAWLVARRAHFPASPTREGRDNGWSDASRTRAGLEAQLPLRTRLALNAVAAALFAIPVVGTLSPVRRFTWLAWIRSVRWRRSPRTRRGWRPIQNPFVEPWDGETAKVACWVRRSRGDSSRCSPSTARTSAARCAGSRSRGCSCARATAASTTPTAARLRAAAARLCSSTSTRSRTASSGCAPASCRRLGAGVRRRLPSRSLDWLDQRAGTRLVAHARVGRAHRCRAARRAGGTSSAAPRWSSSCCRSSPASAWPRSTCRRRTRRGRA